MADYYFHYTSRVAAQLIIAADQLSPGAGGAVYLTDEVYATGAEAAQQLAIPVTGPVAVTLSGTVLLTKPVEVVCLIPAARIPDIAPGQAEDVDALRDPRTKEVIYLGGGRQFRYPRPIDVAGLRWLPLGSP